MPRSTFLNQDFVLAVLAVYGATVAFTRWFPEADLVAVEAHPSSYLKTFGAASQSALTLYIVHLVVDIVRVLALAVLESAAFSFALIDDVFEPFSYAFLVFSLVPVTKDILMIGCIKAFPEANEVAAAKVAELMPLSVNVEYGLLAAGALFLAKGLYSWTYAIGRDKRQVIPKETLKKTQ
ncbi:hypothetical protein EDD11_010561 [Mortierella claussenii]|nr:hypothetical protein EDD11_010561 [Mortierella claussenii]